jgi:3-hydroxybutyryl-CoA dehydrogenase
MVMKIKTVGIIGSGQMGGGIAHVCAQSGYDVVLSDISDELLKKGLGAIAASLERSVKKGTIQPHERDVIFKRISGKTNIESHNSCDLVIEAVTEDMNLKKRIFSQLDGICLPHTILATNTSSLSVRDIAAATRRPDKVLGLHFFNPPPVMALIELIKTDATADDMLEAVKVFGETLGKTVVIVQDSPGFIVNRLMIPQIFIAIRMLESSLAAKEDIDIAMVLGLNHPIGPLALADLIGLDTVLDIAASIHGELGESEYDPPELLRQLVSDGHLGRKTKRGFYEYT